MCACKMAERGGRAGLDTGIEGNWEAGREVGNLAAVRVVRLGVGGGPRGGPLRQLPVSPGRQLVQGEPLLTQEHLKHLADPLQRQQRRNGTETDGITGAGDIISRRIEGGKN